MSHEIESMLYVGKPVWHNLGKHYENAPSLEEAIVGAGLDWKVETKPCFTEKNEKLTAQYVRRMDNENILGVVGPGYHALQNAEAFEFFRPFIDTKQATIETAGSLSEGKKVFVLAKLALDNATILKNDEVSKYVLLSNSHDGTLAVRVGYTPIRVCCANTLAMAHNDKASQLVKVRHTKNMVNTLNDIQGIMNMANAEFEASVEQYRHIAKKVINQEEFEKYVKLVFQKPEKDECARLITDMSYLFDNGVGSDIQGVRGTLWGAYNSITEYLQYVKGKDENSRLSNMWFKETISQRALKIAVNM